MKKFFIFILISIQFNYIFSQEWQPLGSGTNDIVTALSVYDGKLIVGGGFVSAGGVSVHQIATWNDTVWGALGEIYNVNAVQCILNYSGDLYASGGMGMGKWTGSDWAPYEIGGWTYSMTEFDGELYSAGSAIRKWDGNVATDVAYANSEIHSMAVYNGELVVSGGFTTIDGTPFNGIAKWDKTNWTPLGNGILMGTVKSLESYNGELYAGGTFKTSGGNTDSFLQKWNGQEWLALETNVDSTVTVLDSINGKLYVGGLFSHAGSVNTNFIAEYDGNNWTALGYGLNGSPKALAEYNNHLYAGGYFTMAGGELAFNIAKINIYSDISDYQNQPLIEVYPNPATCMINIDLKHDVTNGEISVLNINGQVCLKKKLERTLNQIDISNLVSGVYFVKLTTESSVQVKKIIIE